MGASVHITDRKPNGGIKGLIERVKKPLVVSVGIQGSQAATIHGKLTIAALAAIHEFGLGHQPVRSWLRAWYDEKGESLKNDIRTGYQKVLSGEISQEVLANALGIRMVSQIVDRWTGGGVFIPLKAETIKRKESSAPLIDTGLMKAAVTFVVGDGGGTLGGGVTP